MSKARRQDALMRAARLLGAGACAALGMAAGYGAVTWYRYGRANRNGQGDELLERFMPTYEIRERHQTHIAAPASVTYAAARELDLARSPLVRAVFRGRELLMGAMQSRRKKPRRAFLEEVLSLGWAVLAEDPGRELVLGAVTQPWRADVVFRGLPPEAFAAFREPGYAKIAWTLAVEPRGPHASVFRTETRVATTDPASRSRFRRYWAIFSPGVLLIRRETLRLVKREAEARARAATD